MDAAVRLRAYKPTQYEEDALRREVEAELANTHSTDSKREGGDQLLPLLSSPSVRPSNGHSHNHQQVATGAMPHQRYSARWWLLFAFGWLACMLLGMHFLEYIDVFVIHRNTSSWLTAMVPLHANSTLFHALKQSSKPSTTTASARRPPPLCSTAHLKPIAAHLYATTPIETLPFLSLPTLTTAGIDPATFRSWSNYNPSFSSQVYHNVCINANTANQVLIFTGKDGLNESEKQQLWDDRRERELKESGVHGYTNWRHWWFDWKWRDEAEGGWRWLPGTTIIERKMAMYHDRKWNFGHMFADFVMPYTMHYINQVPLGNTTLTRLTHHIDRILIHTGCLQPASPYSPAPPLVDPFSPSTVDPLTNASVPAVYPEATADTVWPVDCPAAAPFNWMMRMMLQTYSGEGRLADGVVLDEPWHGLRLTAMWNKSETPSQCVEDHFEETVCIERLVVMGRQEDRDNTRASEWENRRAFWVIRNVTMKTMGIEQPPMHIAWNASHISQRERRKIRKVLAFNAAVDSTVTARLFTASLNRTQFDRVADGGVVKVAAASHQSFVMPDELSTALPPPRPRVLLYGRQDADRRLWTNVESTMRALSHVTTVSLTYLSTMHDLSLCEQMLVFSQHDVFIMPKGAALFGTLWAPDHSLVLELYPTPGVDWTWLRMFNEGLQFKHVRVDSDRRADCPGGPDTQRPGGQDDCFETDAPTVLRVLESSGVDVSEGMEVPQSDRLTASQ